jgi:hypothetical protein
MSRDPHRHQYRRSYAEGRQYSPPREHDVYRQPTVSRTDRGADAGHTYPKPRPYSSSHPYLTSRDPALSDSWNESNRSELPRRNSMSVPGSFRSMSDRRASLGPATTPQSSNRSFSSYQPERISRGPEPNSSYGIESRPIERRSEKKASPPSYSSRLEPTSVSASSAPTHAPLYKRRLVPTTTRYPAQIHQELPIRPRRVSETPFVTNEPVYTQNTVPTLRPGNVAFDDQGRQIPVCLASMRGVYTPQKDRGRERSSRYSGSYTSPTFDMIAKKYNGQGKISGGEGRARRPERGSSTESQMSASM